MNIYKRHECSRFSCWKTRQRAMATGKALLALLLANLLWSCAGADHDDAEHIRRTMDELERSGGLSFASFEASMFAPPQQSSTAALGTVNVADRVDQLAGPRGGDPCTLDRDHLCPCGVCSGNHNRPMACTRSDPEHGSKSATRHAASHGASTVLTTPPSVTRPRSRTLPPTSQQKAEHRTAGCVLCQQRPTCELAAGEQSSACLIGQRRPFHFLRPWRPCAQLALWITRYFSEALHGRLDMIDLRILY